jgi:hypothetical protein
VPVPEVLPVHPPTTIRLHGTGLQARKFKTHRPTRKIREGVEEMLYDLGLSLDEEDYVYGSLRHAFSWACTAKFRGEVTGWQSRGGIEIDLSWYTSMTAAAILICIFLFPIGLVLMLVLQHMVQSDAKRMVDDSFRELRSRLGMS